MRQTVGEYVGRKLSNTEFADLLPAKRARERNDEGRRRWMGKRWPTIKETPGGEEPGFCSKTKVESRSGRR
jgi:hypothetical protein